jgi:hypothetical protein
MAHFEIADAAAVLSEFEAIRNDVERFNAFLSRVTLKKGASVLLLHSRSPCKNEPSSPEATHSSTL